MASRSSGKASAATQFLVFPDIAPKSLQITTINSKYLTVHQLQPAIKVMIDYLCFQRRVLRGGSWSSARQVQTSCARSPG